MEASHVESNIIFLAGKYVKSSSSFSDRFEISLTRAFSGRAR